MRWIHQPSSTTLTAAGSAHTKGSYAELVSSTSLDADGFFVHFFSTAGANRRYLVDLALGAAASEQIIVANLFIHIIDNARDGTSVLWMPLSIPSGSRLSARCQSSTASSTIGVKSGLVALPSGSLWPHGLRRATTYGANTATTGGVQMTYGNGSKGSYAEIIASTTNPMRHGLLTLGAVTTGFATSGSVDLAIGGGGSEQIVIADLVMLWNTTPNLTPLYIDLPWSLPSGSRVAVRGQTNQTGEKTDFTLIGFD